MMVNEIENDRELQQVLWACYKCWRDEWLSPEKRIVCYTWVVRVYEERFGVQFHQSSLRRLAKLGLLKQGDTSRSGHRRYYRIVAPDQVDDLLKKWNLS